MNEAFGFQVFCTIQLLLMFGVINTFTFAPVIDGQYLFSITQIIEMQLYIHLVLFEISYYGYSTYQEVKFKDISI